MLGITYLFLFGVSYNKEYQFLHSTSIAFQPISTISGLTRPLPLVLYNLGNLSFSEFIMLLMTPSLYG